MKKKFVQALAVLLCATTLYAQSNTLGNQSAPGANDGSKQPVTKSNGTSGFALEDSTPVKLRINRTVSSADAHVGDNVDFEVLEEVLVNGVLVIPKGGLAVATVTEAQSKRRMARGGKLDINIDYVRLLDGEKAALRAIKEVKGGGHTGAMTGGIVATSLVFFPAAPFFLFMHGKDITIPKGTEVTAYINGEMKLDASKFQHPSNDVATATPVSGQSSTGAQLQLSSLPASADIEIDGNYVGSTPSTIGVTPGSHELVVKKAGFKNWEKKITVSSGDVRVSATLEPETKQ